MINMTDTMNEQVKQMMDMQARSLEPMRVFASVAVEAAEKVARQNYAVAGDVLEFSTKQVQLPLSTDNLSDVASAQMAESNAFIELMNGRATEYADMAQQLSTKMREAAESVSASFSK